MSPVESRGRKPVRVWGKTLPVKQQAKGLFNFTVLDNIIQQPRLKITVLQMCSPQPSEPICISKHFMCSAKLLNKKFMYQKNY